MIVHETPGLLDIRSLTTFGISVKPNAKSPIGYFGTGLKYAIAVLLRHGQGISVWIGEQPYEFHTVKSEFRGRDFLSVRMMRQRGVTRRWFTEELPYTTELGRNWELWMALRELHANTLDEGGHTRAADSAVASGVAGATRIFVSGEAYAHEFAHLDRIFLPGERAHNTNEILPGESRYAYYRGMRVGELQRRSLMTYCVNSELSLTEDRTLSATYLWDWYVRRALMGCEDERVLRRVLQAGDDTYEGSIRWDADELSYCSPAFLEAVRRWGRRGTYVFVTRELTEQRAPQMDWRRQLLIALDGSDDATLLQVVRSHASELRGLLRASYDRARAERGDLSISTPPATPPASTPEDDVPF
jgi:hypothetical protein